MTAPYVASEVRPTSDGIADHFRGLIAAGILAPGERLPSVRQLARDLSIAPGTVAKAFQRLDADGMITTRHGSGTRVADRQGALPTAVLDALRHVVDEGDRHNIGIDTLRSTLDAMWTTTHPNTPPAR